MTQWIPNAAQASRTFPISEDRPFVQFFQQSESHGQFQFNQSGGNGGNSSSGFQFNPGVRFSPYRWLAKMTRTAVNDVPEVD
ncbi:hypothetical protein BDQ17DRAFT_1428714 [Cyathus striatus]|nr:hypothetical protein BDQ17DRAFT_1428714 [Cyathus striatus]